MFWELFLGWMIYTVLRSVSFLIPFPLLAHRNHFNNVVSPSSSMESLPSEAQSISFENYIMDPSAQFLTAPPPLPPWMLQDFFQLATTTPHQQNLYASNLGWLGRFPSPPIPPTTTPIITDPRSFSSFVQQHQQTQQTQQTQQQQQQYYRRTEVVTYDGKPLRLAVEAITDGDTAQCVSCGEPATVDYFCDQECNDTQVVHRIMCHECDERYRSSEFSRSSSSSPYVVRCPKCRCDIRMIIKFHKLRQSCKFTKRRSHVPRTAAVETEN